MYQKISGPNLMISLHHIFILLSHTMNESGYRLWNLETKKVLPNRDIIFTEGQNIKDIQKEKRQTMSLSNDDDVSHLPHRRR